MTKPFSYGYENGFFILEMKIMKMGFHIGDENDENY